MKTHEAIEIIQAGLMWANWTDEQKEAMKIAIKSINEVSNGANVPFLTKEERAIREFNSNLKETQSEDLVSRHLACGFLNGMRYMNDLYKLKINFLDNYLNVDLQTRE